MLSEKNREDYGIDEAPSLSNMLLHRTLETTAWVRLTSSGLMPVNSLCGIPTLKASGLHDCITSLMARRCMNQLFGATGNRALVVVSQAVNQSRPVTNRS